MVPYELVLITKYLITILRPLLESTRREHKLIISSLEYRIGAERYQRFYAAKNTSINDLQYLYKTLMLIVMVVSLITASLNPADNGLLT